VHAEYGKGLVRHLAQALTRDFGKGFDASSLWRMRSFFLTCPKVAALRRELSWTHFRTLLAVDDDRARQWYMNEAADQGWSSRALPNHLPTGNDTSRAECVGAAFERDFGNNPSLKMRAFYRTCRRRRFSRQCLENLLEPRPLPSHSELDSPAIGGSSDLSTFPPPSPASEL